MGVVERTAWACFTATALSLAFASGVAAQKPVRVSCGATIRADTKLANDLADCPGNGITIGADGITLDLNGHVVDGDGAGDDNGIDNSAGHDGVTIEGGSVRDFVEGVVIDGASENRVQRVLTSRQGHAGILVAASRGVDVERNSSSGNATGIVVIASRDVRVERNAVSDSEFGGIPVFGSRHVRIADNSVSGSRSDAGVGIYDDSDHNVVEHNSLSRNGAAIALDNDSDHNLLRQNRATGNGDGVILDVGTHDNRVTENTVQDSFFGGVEIVGSDDNVIAGNSIAGNNHDGSEAGIHVLSWPDDERETSDRNVMSGNTLVRNDGDGILVDAGQSQNVISANRASENTDDGIDVDAPATTLANNTTNHNHDLGLEAVPGVTDRGGNTAHGNGNPLQCTNVFCG